MDALDRKLIRDFERLWFQALAIALVLACGVTLLLTAFGMHRALTETRDAYYERNRFADIFVSVRRAPLSLLPEIRALPGVIEAVEHVDGQAALVEHVGPADVLDPDLGRLERARRDDDAALLLEDAMHPVDGRRGLGRRLHGEVVVELVLEVAGLVGTQPGEGSGHRGRLQAGRRDVLEVHEVGHERLLRRLAARMLVAGRGMRFP